MILSKRWSVLALAGLYLGAVALGCGGDSSKSSVDEHLSVDNVAPVGSVGGQVLDGLTDTPLSGVTVTIVAGSFAAKGVTDASGIFAVSGVPASGPVLATFTKSGYLSADLVGAFANAAGQFPVSNATVTFGPLELLPSTGSFSLFVFDESGAPAQGHQMTLTTRVRFLNVQSGLPVSSGSYTAVAQVTGAGQVTFPGLPDYYGLGHKVDTLVDVAVPPYDADGDGYFEFPGQVYTYDVLDLGNPATGNPQTTIVLDTSGGYPTTLSVVASNVQALEGWPNGTYAPDTIPPVGPISVLFNQPVDPDSLLVSVFDEEGIVEHVPNVQVSGSSAQIGFPTALPVGAEYNMRITARAATGDRLATGSFDAAFFVIDETAPVSLTIETEDTDPTNPTRIVTFSEPVGFGLPGQSLSLASNCVLFFEHMQVGPNPGLGDDVGEWGNADCYAPTVFDVPLTPVEPDPVQPGGVGRSGYCRKWKFDVPFLDGGAAFLPSGTPVHFAFNHVDSASRVMRRANGEPLPEIVENLP